ncbi:hypothetical protein SETIT_4G036900v2 [Setaria italica]|uniref:Uncharacterized protein n=1 Tax=Setaria italica TaxID=4555 RepID=K3XZG7_SETIT|nr:hypothetical protein SETIT_4G036900v2 [Setaria italica]
MPPAASAPIAFSGLCVGISAAVLPPFLSKSPPGAFDAAQAAAQAQFDPAPHGMLAAVATFFTAITIIYVHLRTGSRGGASAGDWRIPEVMFFILCTSVALVELFLCIQPGPVQAPVLLRVAAVQLLPYAGAATFYLSLVLTYVHVRAATAAAGGAGNEEYPAVVELLNTMTLAAALVTGVLSSITAALVFNTK